jgi:hypothetical protein
MRDMGEKMFPIQSDTTRERPYETLPSSEVPWWLAKVAWAVYESKYGKSQSMERMAERGGFGRGEFLWLLRGGKEDDWDFINKHTEGRK